MAWKICLVLAAALMGGCPLQPTPPTVEQQRHEVDAVTKQEYYVFVPHSYRHDRPMPVIVTCHGTWPYDVAEQQILEWRWLGEQYGCIVVAPVLAGTDGIFGDGPVVGMIDDERRILSILSALGRQYNLDRANVMITGFSGGGFPAYWVGLRNPEVFSVVAARNCNFNQGNLDGWWPPQARNLRIIVYYGEADLGPIIAQSKAAIEYLRGKGFTLATAVVPGAGHDRHPEVAMRFFQENMRRPHASLASARQ